MPYIKMPILDPLNPITSTQYRILYALCLLRYRYTSPKSSPDEFYQTDRDLAAFAGCSMSAVEEAKKALSGAGCISYWIGEKNRTYYTILFS